MRKKITTNYDIEIIEWINIIAKHYKLNKQDVYNDLLKSAIAQVLEKDTTIIKMINGGNNE